TRSRARPPPTTSRRSKPGSSKPRARGPTTSTMLLSSSSARRAPPRCFSATPMRSRPRTGRTSTPEPRSPTSSGSSVSGLKAIAKYLRQAGSAFSQAYMEETFADNAKLARLLVELFRLRFDPALASSGDAKVRELVVEIEAALDAVTSLDQDRILRSFLSVIQAMLRTSYFRGEDG